MKVKGIIAEDFCNFKKPAMFIASSKCNWKCCKEAGIDISECQNSELASSPTHEIDDIDIFRMYDSNPITKAVVIGGLEPMLQFEEVVELIDIFRRLGCYDDFVIYTGYYPDEIPEACMNRLADKNVIVKYGRYIPNRKSKFDEVLGVTLASDNQFAEVV